MNEPEPPPDDIPAFDLRALLAARGAEAFALHERYVNPQMPRVLRTIGFDVDYVRAEGAYLYDRDGRRYLDFLSGFGVFALGRCHPAIEQALRDAIDCALPNLVQMDCAPLSGLLAEALVARMPDDGYRCFFTNSGAEAVETVMKYVRCATGRSRILYADHAFHGLSMGALSLNGGREFRDRFGTLLPGCDPVPFGDLDALERALASGDVAAFVVEPIQGKGVFVAPDGYLRAAADLCHRHGALLAVDEVQTGLGRSGTFFAFEQADVVPDLVTVAKALSGGYVPVGAVIARSDVVERVFDKMDRAVVHSSTFGQNVLAMTAGLATLHAIDAESIVERASTIGAALMSGLDLVAKRHELVHEVRGRGLMIGIEFSRPRSVRLRAQWTLLESMRTGLFTQMVIVPLFRDHGILSQVAGDHQNVLKILPPLITTEAQADEFVTAIDAVLGELERSLGLLWGVGSSLALPALRRAPLIAERYVSTVAKPLPDLSLADWVVLGLVAEGPTHGWPIVLAVRADGELGRMWTVPRPIVYRSITTLTEAGYIEARGATTESRGPKRTIVQTTRAGRAALKRWLATPVEHIRDVRTELLVKLALLDRSGSSSRELVDRQIAHLAPVMQAVSGASTSEGFDLVLARWRREQALAVDRFLRSLTKSRTP